MAGLAAQVAGLVDLIPRDRPVIYLDYPVHTNVGDLLIEQAIEAFLSNHGYRLHERRSAYDYSVRQMARAPRDATVILHGGGNFGDLYDLHQRFRERVVRHMPQNRIVMLPQTIHFNSPERERECAALFSGHRNLIVCLRDLRSLEHFQLNYANRCVLMPDMAHYLWNGYARTRSMAGGAGRRLRFFRGDKELLRIPNLEGRWEGPIDWPDTMTREEERHFRILYRLHRHSPLAGNILPLSGLWRRFRDRLADKAVKLLSQYDAVASNRLHMVILGTLLARRVGVVDNSYGKLSAYYRTWFEPLPNVTLLEC